MVWMVMAALAVLTALLMVIERKGAPVTLQLSFKGDLKREGRWFAQYGQGACAIVSALLIWRLDDRRLENGWPIWTPILVAVFVAGFVAVVVKRSVGRVRPRRERAGQFLGPTLRHHSYRESFPSSHTASAVAMSLVLSRLYPEAAVVFWTMAGICAAMRYLMDAHWPSDVVAGFVLGYSIALATVQLMRV